MITEENIGWLSYKHKFLIVGDSHLELSIDV